MKAFTILLVLSVLMISAQAWKPLTPQWIENNVRLLSWSPLAWGIPGITRFPFFGATSYIAFGYLAIMGFFGRWDAVIEFYTDFVTVYAPTTGLYYF